MYRRAVYVVDDDASTTDQLDAALGPKTQLVHCATGEAVLDAIMGNDIAGCFLELRLPDMSGLDVLRTGLRRPEWPPTVLIGTPSNVDAVVDGMKTGACGFLQKPLQRRAIRSAAARLFRSSRRLREEQAVCCAIRNRFARLTRRERQILERVARGEQSKAIARALDISTGTVHVHRKHVMLKTGASSIAELVRWCVTLERAEERRKHLWSALSG